MYLAVRLPALKTAPCATLIFEALHVLLANEPTPFTHTFMPVAVGEAFTVMVMLLLVTFMAVALHVEGGTVKTHLIMSVFTKSVPPTPVYVTAFAPGIFAPFLVHW
jgi:hypothetical protein